MFWLGFALSLIGGLWIIVNAFRNGGVLWGLGSLFIPLVALVYAVMNFGQNKVPLLLCVAGTVLTLLGYGSFMEQAALQGAADAMPQ